MRWNLRRSGWLCVSYSRWSHRPEMHRVPGILRNSTPQRHVVESPLHRRREVGVSLRGVYSTNVRQEYVVDWTRDVSATHPSATSTGSRFRLTLVRDCQHRPRPGLCEHACIGNTTLSWSDAFTQEAPEVGNASLRAIELIGAIFYSTPASLQHAPARHHATATVV